MEKSLTLFTEIERVGFGKRLGSSVLDFILSLLPGIILEFMQVLHNSIFTRFFYDEAQLKTFQAGFSGDIAATIIGFVTSLAGIVFTSLFFYIFQKDLLDKLQEK